jgi:hypothetical protein
MSGSALGDNVQGAALIIIALIAFIWYFGIARRPRSHRFAPRSHRFRTSYPPSRFENNPSPGLKDVGQQLHAVMEAPFQKRRLLSYLEYNTFKIVEDEMIAARRGHRVFAQTSLGEILTSPNSDAFHSINSKRVDILIVDSGGWPVAAIEYQGGGHYQGTAAGRDAIKKEALRKAGIRYIEVSESDSGEQIRYRVREQLGWNTKRSVSTGM